MVKKPKPKLTDREMLKLLNDHREACGVPRIRRWAKSREALELELERVEGNAEMGNSSWNTGP